MFSLDSFLTSDAVMMRCLSLAHVAAETDIPILILGESGTGKTMLAEAIHNSSNRSRGPFIGFNAAALSETLLDSQLFGHDKGAFTGATQRVKGKFELADGGTLFVDEVADMSLAAQAKILRAIESGEFERLGSERLQRADVRVISATQLPLQESIASNRFRKDLFYRISGLTITLPPLRERPNDLRSLIASEIASASKKHGKTLRGLDARAAELLFSYHWPGNLRELKAVVHAAVILSRGDIILPDAVILDKTQSKTSGSSAVALPATPQDNERNEDLSLKKLEQDHIQRVLQRLAGNKRRAASALGIARATLDRKLPKIDGHLTRHNR